MRICTITCSNTDNHGAKLQAYALAKHYHGAGHKVQVIDYRPYYMNPGYRVLYFPSGGPKEWVRFIWFFPHRIRMKKRHERFVSFSRKYIPFTERIYHNVQELRNDPPLADMYVAGSDQIWNPTFPNGSDSAFFLDFGPLSVQRESYAASFAVDALDQEAELFANKHLRRFDKITVREQSGLTILEHMGLHGELQDDPVFLLSAENWDEIADETGRKDHYLLVYDFFRDDRIKKKAQALKQRHAVKIFSISPFFLHYADQNYCTAGPETFVALIKNADFVITNSFHAIAFSAIFKRTCYFIPRPDGLNNRMFDFIKRHMIPDNGNHAGEKNRLCRLSVLTEERGTIWKNYFFDENSLIVQADHGI